MSPDFTSTYMCVEDMGDFIQVWIADQVVDTSDYLSFQRAHEFDEQNIRLGMDKVYVERNDQGFSGYGGIELIELFADHLSVRFDKKGTRFMGMSAMKVRLEFDKEAFKALRKGLAECFEGFDCYRDRVTGDGDG